MEGEGGEAVVEVFEVVRGMDITRVTDTNKTLKPSNRDGMRSNGLKLHNCKAH